MGAKIKTQKNLWTKNFPPPPPTIKKKTEKKSHAEFPSLKNFQKALNDIRWKIKFWKTSFVVLINFAEVCGQDMPSLHKSSDCFEYPQNSLIEPSHPKKFLPRFPTLKKSWNWKFQTPKTLRSSSSLEIPSTRWGVVFRSNFMYLLFITP